MEKNIEYGYGDKVLFVSYKIERGCKATRYHPGDPDEIEIACIRNIEGELITEKQLNSETINEIFEAIQYDI